MKTVSISGSPRENVGKKDAKQVRQAGNVPCVLYGGEKQIYFHAHTLSFRDLVYTPEAYFVELEIDGNQYKAVMQDIQFHPITEEILHIDFLEIFPDKTVTLAIPVKLTGSSKGVMKGGKLVLAKRKLKLKAIPEKLPEKIEIDITSLEIGDSVKVAGLELEEGVKIMEDQNAMIVTVRTSRTAALAADEEGEGEEGEEGAEGAEGEAKSE